MRRAFAPALALAAAALLAAGCGDDDDSQDDGAGGTQSKAAWVKQADGICAAANADLNQAVQDQFGAKPPSDADQEQFATETLVPNLQSQHDEIADLAAPEGAEQQAEKLLASLQHGIDELSDDPSLVAEAGAKAPLAEADQLAAELGLTDCGG